MQRLRQRLRMNRSALVAVFIVVGALIALLEVGIARNNAALLFTLAFWIALAEGCVALVAVADLSKAEWIKPVKADLLSVYPLILFLAALFPFLGLKLSIYPWSAKPNAWLNPSFFVARNVGLLLITSLVARLFARESLREGPRKTSYAVWYMLCFVVTQSLVAFDWVMPLEYPWYSTLFGGFFFVESLYTGIALGSLMTLVRLQSRASGEKKRLIETLRDVSTLMFGFALFWAGLFFAQYLVIWYGNLPEEVSFLAKRFSDPVWGKLAPVILFALFVVPFPVLLGERAKVTPSIVRTMALLILGGVFLERLFFIAPAASVNAALLVIESIGVGMLFAALWENRTPRESRPQEDQGL